MDVHVDIGAIVLYCDDSLLSVDIGLGYRFKKTYLDAWMFHDRVIYQSGDLELAYRSSVLEDEGGKYVICLEKQDSFAMTPKGGSVNDPELDEPIDRYESQQIEYIYRAFYLLNLYQEGNIGLYDVFFRFNYERVIAFKINVHSRNQAKNIVDERRYIVASNESDHLSRFIADHRDIPYDLIEGAISIFISAREQMDLAGFVQYMTVLEMLLINRDEKGPNDKGFSKKLAVSNRTAALLGESDKVRDDVSRMYELRSEVVHEGKWTSISENDLHMMESYARRVLLACLTRIDYELATVITPLTWLDIKTRLIDDLKEVVRNKGAYEY